MARTALPRIAIIGCGPIGIEAGVHSHQLGLPFKIYDRGDVAEHLGRWGHVRLFSPFSQNHTQLGADLIRREHPGHELPGPNELLTGLEFRDRYLVPLALTAALGEAIHTKTEVLQIGRVGLFKTDQPNDPRRATAPFRLLVRDDKQAERIEEADAILDCTGTYGSHRWIGEGGIPALGERAAERHIVYGLDDILGTRQAYYSGKSTIVIGAGYSAATTVCQLSSLAENNSATWVIWLSRRPRGTPLPRNPADPLRERERLAARANNLASRGEGNVEYHALTTIDMIEAHGPDKGFRITGRTAGQEMVWEVDRVIANVGYAPDLGISRELHVLESNGPGSLRQPEPNYFVLGSKSFGRDPGFLLKTGYDQIRDVFALLLNKR